MIVWTRGHCVCVRFSLCFWCRCRHRRRRRCVFAFGLACAFAFELLLSSYCVYARRLILLCECVRWLMHDYGDQYTPLIQYDFCLRFCFALSAIDRTKWRTKMTDWGV